MQTEPPTLFKLSRPEERLVDQEIKKLLKKGAIEVVEHAENQFLSNIFTVPKKDGTRRPVIDLRQLNQFVKKVPFKMEDLTQIPSVLQKWDFLCKIDLQDAYLSIPVAKKARVYLCFLWKGKLYQFICLPFRLASSPRIFIKYLKPLLVYLRALGVHLLVYLKCLEQAQLIVGLLEKLGYLINREKSVLEPTQRLEYLGFIRHCGNEVFLARNENTQNSESGREISLRTNFGKTTSQSSRPVAGYPSSYNSCSFVFSKSPERPFQGSKFLRRKTKLPDSGHAFLGVKRGVDVVEKLASFPQQEKFSGSKRTGNKFLGCLKERLGSSFGRWCLEERIQHIIVLELQAAFLAIKALLPKIDKPHVQFAIDNLTAVGYINKLGGTHSHQLSLLAIELCILL